MSKHQIGYTVFGGFTLIYVYGYIVNGWSLLYYISFFVLWFLLILYGSFFIQTNYHLKAISSVKTTKKLVAITFDDGPTEFTDKILDLLRKDNHKATFFCVGNRIEVKPALAKRIVEEEHLIGNHTYSHSKNIGFKNTKGLIEELNHTDQLIKKYTGNFPKYFRPPFGVTNPNTMRAIRKTKHIVVGWSIRSLDTVLENEDKIFLRIKRQVKPGSIILLHDTSEKSILVLERLLIYLNENNYRSITVDELIKLKS
jgi:peptidoglycan/xylan/chitin deacetylase (PgdA/CDA1 family)